jgi:hypothetical protein
MVEQPADADPIQMMKEEAREPRQEAVVKGITPAQPAPLPVERIAAESHARPRDVRTGGAGSPGFRAW